MDHPADGVAMEAEFAGYRALVVTVAVKAFAEQLLFPVLKQRHVERIRARLAAMSLRRTVDHFAVSVSGTQGPQFMSQKPSTQSGQGVSFRRRNDSG
jgi:hypothetical protein